jgi:hypothetical protein
VTKTQFDVAVKAHLADLKREWEANRATIHSGGVEQLAARRAHNPKVVGSSPTPATNKRSQ